MRIGGGIRATALATVVGLSASQGIPGECLNTYDSASAGPASDGGTVAAHRLQGRSTAITLQLYGRVQSLLRSTRPRTAHRGTACSTASAHHRACVSPRCRRGMRRPPSHLSLQPSSCTRTRSSQRRGSSTSHRRDGLRRFRQYDEIRALAACRGFLFFFSGGRVAGPGARRVQLTHSVRAVCTLWSCHSRSITTSSGFTHERGAGHCGVGATETKKLVGLAALHHSIDRRRCPSLHPEQHWRLRQREVPAAFPRAIVSRHRRLVDARTVPGVHARRVTTVAAM